MQNSGQSVKLEPSTEEKCVYLSLETNFSQAGYLTFWVWVGAEPWDIYDLNSNGEDETIVGDPFRVFIKDGIADQDYSVFYREISTGINKAGVGGQNNNFHDIIDFPASHPNVIAVGASDSGNVFGSESRAYFSQYSDKLDVVAPGVGIRTTANGNGYTRFSGTSSSAPIVSGIVANMLAINGSLTTTDIRNGLQESADQKGPYLYPYPGDRNNYYGHGRVNGYKAVQRALNQSISEPDEIALCGVDPNPDESICFPIKSSENKIAVICL